MVFYARSSSSDYVSINEHNTTLTSYLPFGAMSSDDLADNTIDFAQQTNISQTLSGGVVNSSSTLNISLYDIESECAGLAGLDRDSLFKQLYGNERLLHSRTSPDTTALEKYSTPNLSAGDDFVFDVTDHANVQRVTNFQFNNGVCEFSCRKQPGP